MPKPSKTFAEKYSSAQAHMDIQDIFIEDNEKNINVIRADVNHVGIPTTSPDDVKKFKVSPPKDPSSHPAPKSNSKSMPHTHVPVSESKTPNKKTLFEQSISPIQVSKKILPPQPMTSTTF